MDLVDQDLAQTVIDTVGALVLVLDREGGIIRWNAACEKTSGYERDEMLGRPFWFLVPPEERGAVESHFHARLASRDYPNSHSSRWTGKNGENRLVSWSNSALLDEHGEVLAVVATGIDLTEQKRAEEARLRQAKRLEALAEASRVFASGLDYKATLDTVARQLSEMIGDGVLIRVVSHDSAWLVPVAVYHPDPQRAALRQRVLQAAPQRTSEGMTARVLAGQGILRITDLSLDVIHGEMKQEYWPYLEGVSSVMIAPLEHRRHVFGHITLMRDMGGPPYSPEDEALLEDLAHRAAQAIENARLYGEAQAAVAARDEFLSIASHELRTPLTALRLALENMRRVSSKEAMEKLPAQYVERVLLTAERQGQRLEKLVAGLLDVSRIHMGRLDLDLEDVELGAIVHETVGALSDEAAQTGSRIEVRGEQVRGCWDRLRISQVVTNLLSNAVKYGGGNVVEVEFAPRGERALLDIRDHGIGIDPADQPQIFERFERAVSSRNYGGLGLGLYIVKRIVEAHGGTVRVDSRPGEGAAFHVELPQRPMVAVRAAMAEHGAH